MSEPFAGRWRALGVLAIAQFIVIADVTIVNVALPSIQHSLHFSVSNLAWVFDAYAILFGGLLLLGGRAADLLGRREVFLAGLGIFGVASLAGGLAGSQGVLIAARAAQGVGAAVLAPSALSIVISMFTDPGERAKALTLWGSLGGIGGTLGVFLGGAIVNAISWRWILFVNVPIVIVGAVGTLWAVPRWPRPKRPARFDLPGAVSITGALLIAVYAIVGSARHGWGSATTIVPLAAAVVLAGVFLLIERSVAEPMVPLGIFRRRSLVGAQFNVLFAAAQFQPIFFLMTQYMQDVRGYTPLHAGACFVPIGVAIVVGAVASQGLVPRVGTKPLMLTGGVLSVIALLLLTMLPADGSFASDLLPAFLIGGLGIGLQFSPALVTGTAEVSAEESGLAAGIINATLQIGAAIGVAVLATVAATSARHGLQAGHGSAVALTHGFTTALKVGVGFAIANVVALTFVLRNYKPGGAPGDDATSKTETAMAVGGEVGAGELVPIKP